MAAAYGDPRNPVCLLHADNRIAFCKQHPALCGKEPGTGEPKWRFIRDIVSGGTEKIERAIAKSYNTNSKFAIGAEAIKARVNYSISNKMPLHAVTDAMVAVEGVTHWVNTGLAEQRGAIPQGKEVGQEGEGLEGGEQGKGQGSHVEENNKVKETGSAAGRGGGGKGRGGGRGETGGGGGRGTSPGGKKTVRPKIATGSPIEEIIKGMPKLLADHKQLEWEMRTVFAKYETKVCPYVTENITKLKSFEKQKKIDEVYLDLVLQGVSRQCAIA